VRFLRRILRARACVSFCLLFFSSSRDEQREQLLQSESVSFYARMCCVVSVGVPLFPQLYVLKKWGTDTKLQKSTLEKISESKEDEDNNGNGPGSF
jgi:hypothetical protein